MRIIHNPNWSRRGCSFLWSSTKLAELCNPSEVYSVRQFFELGRDRSWPRDLPSGNGNTLIVAGLEGCLDTLTPDDAETWLERDLKARMLAFQAEYEGQAGLVFFLATGQKRLQMNRATETYALLCAPPFAPQTLAFGRVLFGGAESDAGRIIDPAEKNQDFDGPAWIGLHHPRIS